MKYCISNEVAESCVNGIYYFTLLEEGTPTYSVY